MRAHLSLLLSLLTPALLAACSEDEAPFGDVGAPPTTSTSGEGGGSAGAGGEGQGAGSSSSTSSSGGSGGGAICVDFGEPCSACELEACEDRYCECYGNVDCGLYASCAIECEAGDTACLQACNTAYPGGITDAVLLNDCAATSCASECEDFTLYELDGCETCLYESCEEAMNGCLAVPDCSALLFCLADCEGVGTCENVCYATYPDGIDPAVPVGMCSTQSCQTECAP